MEESEFVSLLEKCRIPVERYVHYRMPSTADAEDVLQNTYLSAFVHFSSLRDKRLFKQWILKIAANECALYYRRKYRHETVPLDSIADLPQEERDIPDVESVLEKLPALYAAVIRSRYLEERSLKEIARLEGIPEGTVKSRLYKARELFRAACPYQVKLNHCKGENLMKPTGNFTEYMPNLKIVKVDRAFKPVKCEEDAFIIARIGNQNADATYRYPEKKLFVVSTTTVMKKARIHGVEGVKICRDTYNVKADKLFRNEAIWFAQLTDEYLRNLAFIRCDGEDDLPTEICTFLEEDYDVIVNGNDRVHGLPLMIEENPTVIGENGEIDMPIANLRYTMGCWDVTIGDRLFACIKACVYEQCGRYTEQYIDDSGRMVLYRVYETAEAMDGCYPNAYLQTTAQNARVTVNGKEYIHLEDRFSEYVL